MRRSATSHRDNEVANKRGEERSDCRLRKARKLRHRGSRNRLGIARRYRRDCLSHPLGVGWAGRVPKRGKAHVLSCRARSRRSTNSWTQLCFRFCPRSPWCCRLRGHSERRRHEAPRGQTLLQSAHTRKVLSQMRELCRGWPPSHCANECPPVRLQHAKFANPASNPVRANLSSFSLGQRCPHSIQARRA